MPTRAATFAVLLWAVPVLAFSPGPEPCDADAKLNARHTADAVFAAKAALPGAKVRGTCTRFSRSMQVHFEQTEVKQGDITFIVQPMAVREGGPWVLRPFRDGAEQESVAKRIRANEVLAGAVPGQPLYCLASTDAPGKTSWFLCSPTRPGVTDSTPTSGHLRGKRTEFEFASWGRVPDDCGCTSFALVNFSMPFAAATDGTPGWCAVAKSEEATDFVKLHPPQQLTVARWHDYAAKLQAADGATVELAVPSGRCFCSLPPACAKDAPAAPKKK